MSYGNLEIGNIIVNSSHSVLNDDRIGYLAVRLLLWGLFLFAVDAVEVRW